MSDVDASRMESPPVSASRMPLTFGVAFWMLVLNVVVMVFLAVHFGNRLDEVESNVGSAGFSESFGPVPADPQLCWLLGSVAEAQGKGKDVAALVATNGGAEDCSFYAARGAKGEPLLP